jgi:DNA mismatch repair protein MutS
LELLREKIKTTLNQDAPVAIAKGMLLLKELMPSWMNYAHSTQGRNSWKELKTRVTTDGTSLKISFNNVFGYYIEVRNLHKDKVP